MKDEMVQMPRSVYDRLLEHLQAHAPTDSWAKSVLDELQREVKPAYLLKSGSYILDGGIDAEYRLN